MNKRSSPKWNPELDRLIIKGEKVEGFTAQAQYLRRSRLRSGYHEKIALKMGKRFLKELVTLQIMNKYPKVVKGCFIKSLEKSIKSLEDICSEFN